MIPAQDVVDLALTAAAKSGRCDETIVIVTDRAEASLRWAGNSMTTNGASTSRTTAVISIVRQGDQARVGSRRSSAVDAQAVMTLVADSEDAAHSAPVARDNAPLLRGDGEPADWDDPSPSTGAGAFGEVARALATGFGCNDRLYGFAHHIVETTFLASSTGLRRRFTQPTGSVEINAKREAASAWAGVSTPWFVDVPVESMLADLPGLDHGRPGSAGGPQRIVGARWGNACGGAADGAAADAVLRSVRRGSGVLAVRAHGCRL